MLTRIDHEKTKREIVEFVRENEGVGIVELKNRFKMSDSTLRSLLVPMEKGKKLYSFLMDGGKKYYTKKMDFSFFERKKKALEFFPDLPDSFVVDDIARKYGIGHATAAGYLDTLVEGGYLTKTREKNYSIYRKSTAHECIKIFLEKSHKFIKSRNHPPDRWVPIAL